MSTPEFFNWTNPWLYVLGLCLVGLLLLIVFWKKFKQWFNKPLEEEDDEEEDDQD